MLDRLRSLLSGGSSSTESPLDDDESIIEPLAFDEKAPYTEPPEGVDVEKYINITEQVKQLKRDREHDRALELLHWAMDETAAEVKDADTVAKSPAPWYFEHAAIVYRKEDRHDDEVAVLERYHDLASDRAKSELTERLERARELAATE